MSWRIRGASVIPYLYPDRPVDELHRGVDGPLRALDVIDDFSGDRLIVVVSIETTPDQYDEKIAEAVEALRRQRGSW